MSLRLGLLGHNISYSLSPRIFSWLFAETGISGTYEIINASPAEFAEFAASAIRDFNGLNVTIPYKQAAFSLCSDYTKEARQCHVVNALKVSERSEIQGANTDVMGVRCALREYAATSDHSNALIFGSGGAARAAILSLREHYPAMKLTLAVRSIRPEIEHDFAGIQQTPAQQLTADLSEFDLIIQCTPVGGRQQPGVPFKETFKFSPHCFVLDMIYSPQETLFLAQARAQRAVTRNGMEMLIGQALHAFEWWTGVNIPFQHASQELLPRLT